MQKLEYENGICIFDEDEKMKLDEMLHAINTWKSSSNSIVTLPPVVVVVGLRDGSNHRTCVEHKECCGMDVRVGSFLRCERVHQQDESMIQY